MYFGGVKAVDGLSVSVPEGSIFGIIGPNGSGKTTLFNVLTGIYRPTAGTIKLRGEDITSMPGHRVAQRGVARTFQNIRLFESMTVLENVIVGHHLRIDSPLLDSFVSTKKKKREEENAKRSALELLEFVHMAQKAEELATNLSYGDQRKVELARALANNPKMLLLDELTAGMNPVEAASIMELVHKVRDQGVTIIIIEHNMKIMMGTAEWIMAMESGKKIAEGIPRDIQKNDAVLEAYLGRE
jgi:ABC-type branched-subunit amino acid transport system ATPase component